MKALEAELAELKKRLRETEDELRRKQKDAEDAKVGSCHTCALCGTWCASIAGLPNTRPCKPPVGGVFSL